MGRRTDRRCIVAYGLNCYIPGGHQVNDPICAGVDKKPKVINMGIDILNTVVYRVEFIGEVGKQRLDGGNINSIFQNRNLIVTESFNTAVVDGIETSIYILTESDQIPIDGGQVFAKPSQLCGDGLKISIHGIHLFEERIKVPCTFHREGIEGVDREDDVI